MDHLDRVRTPEELLNDLAKAFEFPPVAIRDYRRGRLPVAQVRPLLIQLVQPLWKSAAFTLVPLFGSAYIASASRHCSVAEGLLIVFGVFLHPRDFAELSGWFRTILYFAIALTLLGFGIVQALKIPTHLLFDVLGGSVQWVEGRVNSREEEKHLGERNEETFYYFEMKDRTFPVSRAAFKALDSGGCYKLYFLPRSRVLVAVEPSTLAAAEKESVPTSPTVHTDAA